MRALNIYVCQRIKRQPSAKSSFYQRELVGDGFEGRPGNGNFSRPVLLGIEQGSVLPADVPDQFWRPRGAQGETGKRNKEVTAL